MVQFIQVNGTEACEKGRDIKSGQMAAGTLASGVMIKQMATANYSMLMEMSTRVSGWMIKLMAKANTFIAMVLFTRASGLMTNKRVME